MAGRTGAERESVDLATESNRRLRWLTASVTTAQALLTTESGPPLDVALSNAAAAAQSDNAMLTLVNANGEPTVRALVGIDVVHVGDVLDVNLSLAGRVIATGEPYQIDDAPNEIIGAFTVAAPMGRALGVPLSSDGEVVGAVTVGWQGHRAPLEPEDIEHLAAFAGHIGVALEVDNARAGRESRLVADAHARIAAELQNSVVRDLFRIGIGLQGAVFDFPEPQRSRILGYASDLDRVIERVRSAVFDTPASPRSVSS